MDGSTDRKQRNIPPGPLVRLLGCNSVTDWRYLAAAGSLAAVAAGIRHAEDCPSALASFVLFCALYGALRVVVVGALHSLRFMTAITNNPLDNDLVLALSSELSGDVALESFLAFQFTVAWDSLDGHQLVHWLDIGFMAALACTVVRVASSLAAVAMASVANGMYARAGEKVVAVVMGALAVMFVCENAGLKLTGLLTSLGVSGLLVALSTQTLLQDAFASVIIAMDVPFRKNDSITLEGGVAGTVESIGLKTTYLRDFGGSLLVLPNKELCSRIIENHSKQQFRKNVIQFEFSPDSDIDALESLATDLGHALGMLRSPYDITDRGCFVKGTGEWGILVEMMYVVRGGISLPDFRALNSEVNISLLRVFRARGLTLASSARLKALCAASSHA